MIFWVAVHLKLGMLSGSWRLLSIEKLKIKNCTKIDILHILGGDSMLHMIHRLEFLFI